MKRCRTRRTRKHFFARRRKSAKARSPDGVMVRPEHQRDELMRPWFPLSTFSVPFRSFALSRFRARKEPVVTLPDKLISACRKAPANCRTEKQRLIKKKAEGGDETL